MEMIRSSVLLETAERDCVCLCETVCGSSQGQPHADEAGPQPPVPSHLRRAAVYPLVIHGLLLGTVLPPHL